MTEIQQLRVRAGIPAGQPYNFVIVDTPTDAFDEFNAYGVKSYPAQVVVIGGNWFSFHGTKIKIQLKSGTSALADSVISDGVSFLMKNVVGFAKNRHKENIRRAFVG